jgi:hypothetical protein
MEIALIISLIALAVALPGCIADSLTVIEKLRARRVDPLFKKKSDAAKSSAKWGGLSSFFKKLASPRPTAELREAF